MIYFCCTEQRRSLVKASTNLNGIDFLEVYDPGETTVPDPERQRRLFLHFLNNRGLAALTKQNIVISGGERIVGIAVTGITYPTGADDTTVTVEVDPIGDFSPYTLRLAPTSGVPPPSDLFDPQPPAGFDPILSAIDFSFKVNCPTDLDCRSLPACPTPTAPAPDLDYQAKDYTTFRQLMLDRVSTLVPGWTERHAADLGVTLVELLAYVGDYLSYQQDAVATEAYLETARSRVSVRRHARLVDYFIGDGCNARAWVQILVAGAPGAPTDVGETAIPLAASTPLLTRSSGLPAVVPMPTDGLQALSRVSTVFATMQPANLFPSHGRIEFHTWGDADCCLPMGATRATLRGTYTQLKAGDILIFEEVLGPDSGAAADADPSHRYAVRLIDVAALDAARQPLVDPLLIPPSTTPTPITEIAWHPADALTFPLCLSASKGTATFQNVSVARGNIVLADHGLLVADEVIGVVPQPIMALVPAGGAHCAESAPVEVPPRFRPTLARSPVTQAAPYPAGLLAAPNTADPTTAASSAMAQSPQDASPSGALSAEPNSTDFLWQPMADLLSSHANDAQFVLEIENDGTAAIRFGDDQHGKRPTPGSVFHARYRIGNGAAGNIGTDAIGHLVTMPTTDARVIGARNPLGAHGGVDPEISEHVRQSAPSAFRIQERAVTPADYGMIAERHAEVRKAAATLRWTGSWYTVFLSIERTGGKAVDAAFAREMASFLETYRMTGEDVRIGGARFVSLAIELAICVQLDSLASQVEAALLDRFSNRILADGSRGYFYPDNFTFGQPVYLGPLIAAAQNVAGVASADVVTFARQGVADPTGAIQRAAIAAGRLELGALEIARLENDPSYPEHGRFTLQIGGGR